MNTDTQKQPEATEGRGEASDLLSDLLAGAVCPACGDSVFIPSDPIRKSFGGDTSDEDPQVWCSDHGHWIGFLSECAS